MLVLNLVLGILTTSLLLPLKDTDLDLIKMLSPIIFVALFALYCSASFLVFRYAVQRFVEKR